MTVTDASPAQAGPVAGSERIGDPQPIRVIEIIWALEREAGNTDTDPRWLAATQLRRMTDWGTRTLMCRIDQRSPEIHSVTDSIDVEQQGS